MRRNKNYVLKKINTITYINESAVLNSPVLVLTRRHSEVGNRVLDNNNIKLSLITSAEPRIEIWSDATNGRDDYEVSTKYDTTTTINTLSVRPTRSQAYTRGRMTSLTLVSYYWYYGWTGYLLQFSANYQQLSSRTGLKYCVCDNSADRANVQ